MSKFVIVRASDNDPAIRKLIRRSQAYRRTRFNWQDEISAIEEEA